MSYFRRNENTHERRYSKEVAAGLTRYCAKILAKTDIDDNWAGQVMAADALD